MKRSYWLLTWLGITVILTGIAWQGHTWFSNELTPLLPDGDAVFRRELNFFTSQGATRLMAIEASPLADQPATAVNQELERLVPLLAPLGATPPRGLDAAGIARLATTVLDHLPELTSPEELAALTPELSADALTTRLADVRQRISDPLDVLSATVVRRDVLGVSGTALRALMHGPGEVRREGQVVVHADGVHRMLPLEIAFEPGAMAQTEALMAAIDHATAAAAARGVRLEPIGSYRHFRENMQTIRSDLFSTLPVGVALVVAVLWSLFGRWRAVVAVHVPALLAMLGALASVVIYGGLVPSAQIIPLPLLGFAAGLLGTSVDYSTNLLAARNAGNERPVRWLLVQGFLTTGLAFAVLITSTVPGLRMIGVLVLGGLATGLAATLWLLPQIAPASSQRVSWSWLCRPLLRFITTHPWRRLGLAAGITLGLAPGLLYLGYHHDLRTLDGSKPASWQALQEFSTRWGSPDNSTFIVADAASLDAALADAAAARLALDLTPSVIEHLLPSIAEQQRRQSAWDAYWSEHGEIFSTALADACARNGLRAQAFSGSLMRYRKTDQQAALLTLETWTDTPLQPLLANLITSHADTWRVASPMAVDAPAAAELRTRLEASPKTRPESHAWVANRGGIGTYLITTVRTDLTTRGLIIAVVLVLLMVAIERRLRRSLAILLPPALALVWTFGLLGWLGQPLTPFALLAAAFIGGIGIDSAIFLASRQRATALAPVLAATITTIVGVGSMMLATHPILRSIGTTLTIGMSTCLIACLLVTPALAGVEHQPEDEP